MSTSTWALPLVIAVVALFVGHCVWLARRARWSPFDPLNLFWGGALVCYVNQPLSYGDVYAAWHSAGTLEVALAYVLLGMACVVVGYELPWGRSLAFRVPSVPATLLNGRALLGGATLVAMGLSGSIYLMSTAPSIADWLAVGRGGTDWGSTIGYLAQLENLLPIGIVFLLVHCSMTRQRFVVQAVVWSLAGAEWLWLVYLGTRSRTITFTFMLLASYYLPRRRFPRLAFIAGLALALLGLVGFQAAYRANFTNLSFNLDAIDTAEAISMSLPPWLGGGRAARGVDASSFAEFNCVMSAVELVPDRIDYNYGYSHLELFTRPIPRALWPDKIYPHSRAYTPLLLDGGLSTAEVATASERLVMGPSFTFVGHWYTVGGGIALALAGIFTGVGFRALRGFLDRDPLNQSALVLFITLAPWAFNEAAAEPMFWMYYVPITHVPLLVVLWWARLKGDVRTTDPLGGGEAAR